MHQQRKRKFTCILCDDESLSTNLDGAFLYLVSPFLQVLSGGLARVAEQQAASCCVF